MKGLYSLFLKRLSEIKTKSEIIPFPLIFEKLCRNFSVTKQDCWEILFLLRDTGFIEIHGTKGIKLIRKYEPQKEAKLNARDIPNTCINECENCHKDFEAKVKIGETCDCCNKEFMKNVDEKVKKAKEAGSHSPDWVLKLNAAIEETRSKRKRAKKSD